MSLNAGTMVRRAAGVTLTGQMARVRDMSTQQSLIDGAALALVVAMALIRWVQVPALVSGMDPGNWLALSQEMLGAHSKAAAVVYPPLIPAVLAALHGLGVSPLDAVRCVGIGASLLPGLGTYVVLRQLGLRWAAVAGVGVSLSGYCSEMLAWGAYPQLAGTGFGLIGIALTVRAFRLGARLSLIWAGVATGLALLCNQLAAAQVLLALAVCVAGLWASAGPLRVLSSGALLGGSALISAGPGLSSYAGLLMRTTPSAINAAGSDGFLSGVAYVFGDAPLAWTVAAVAVVAGLVIAHQAGGAQSRATWCVLLGVLGASILPAAITSEVRFLFLAQSGLALGVGLVLSVRRRPTWWRVAVGGLALLASLTIGISGVQRFEQARHFYAVLDPSLADGLVWLGEHAQAGEVAVSSPSQRNWPLGWWVEGLAGVPTWAECDERWVAFGDEKEMAGRARRLLSQNDPEAAAMAAADEGVTWLVLDARDNGRPALWRRGLRPGGRLTLAFANATVAIFHVAALRTS